MPERFPKHAPGAPFLRATLRRMDEVLAARRARIARYLPRLAGAIGMSFFVYVFVNGGMVAGLLPVVGVPMTMVSYGGTSAVSLLVGFGVLMSIHANRKVHD